MQYECEIAKSHNIYYREGWSPSPLPVLTMVTMALKDVQPLMYIACIGLIHCDACRCQLRSAMYIHKKKSRKWH
jgi:hypothetical protein